MILGIEKIEIENEVSFFSVCLVEKYLKFFFRSVYTLDLLKLKPGAGFYTLTVSVSSSSAPGSAKLVGTAPGNAKVIEVSLET